MSEDIAQAAADRAAELAAIRERWAGGRAVVARLREALEKIDRTPVGACEDDFGGLPEPCPRCAEMRDIAANALADPLTAAHAPDDVRTLLARLDEATAAADAAIAEYSRFAAELQAARAVVRAVRKALDACPFCRAGHCRAEAHDWLRQPLAAYDATRPAVDIARLFGAE